MKASTVALVSSNLSLFFDTTTALSLYQDPLPTRIIPHICCPATHC